MIAETNVRNEKYGTKSKVDKKLTFKERMETLNYHSNSDKVITFLQEYTEKLSEQIELFGDLIYGINVQHVSSNFELYPKIIVLSDRVKTDLMLIDQNKKKCIYYDLTKINEISFGLSRGRFKKLEEKKRASFTLLKEDLCLTIHFPKAQSLDLCFHNKESLDGFLYSLFFIIKAESDEINQMDRVEYNINKIWRIYDIDHSDKMEFEEFKNFIREINFVKNGFKLDSDKDLLTLFSLIDKDNSGKIDYNEFLIFYKELSSGKEFENIFNIYTKGSKKMKVLDLVSFMINEQKESPFHIDDAVQIIIDFKTDLNINKDENLQTIFEKYNSLLFLTLEEFKNFITNKKYCHIYNLEKLSTHQDMTRPLNEYFIYSSHNTYLTQHQLYGESNVEMYNFAVMNGCRLVELDCWDGEEEPIVTHGRTLTSIISFRDVLKNLKENSFKSNPYPVLFSIEMHCKPSQQQIMAKLYREILEDIYVIDENFPPEKYPSPEDLKNNFIIKEGRSRILRKEKRETFRTKVQFENEIENNDISDEFDKEGFDDIPDEKDKNFQIDIYLSPSIKDKNVTLSNKSLNYIPKNEELKPILPKEENEMNYAETVNKDNSMKAILENYIHSNPIEDQTHNGYRIRKTLLSDIKEVSKEYDQSSYFPYSMHRESDLNSFQKFNTRNTPINIRAESYMKETKSLTSDKQRELDNREMFLSVNTIHYVQTKIIEEDGNRKSHDEGKTVKEIQELTGLIKIKLDWKKLDIADYYQPWECPAIKENKINDVFRNFEMRKKIVNFCKNSFLKVYPSIGRFDSSNIDPVKSWICGVQIAALNLQSLQGDQMLINNTFFKINGNCGYVLKPDFLRIGSDYNRQYDKPRLKVHLNIISGDMLHYCNKVVSKEMTNISLSCYIVGSGEDDNLNTKFNSKKYNKNLINLLFEEESYVFNVYEPELSFIIIKLFSDGDVAARACIPVCIIKEGLRVIPLYDNLCKEIAESQLIAKVKVESI